MSDSVRPHRQQPTRLPHPWDFPGKSTGVGCHCLLCEWSLGISKLKWLDFATLFIRIFSTKLPKKYISPLSFLYSCCLPQWNLKHSLEITGTGLNSVYYGMSPDTYLVVKLIHELMCQVFLASIVHRSSLPLQMVYTSPLFTKVHFFATWALKFHSLVIN